MTDPLGFAMDEATVSWIAESDESKQPSVCRILVSSDSGMRAVLYDSGEIEAGTHSLGTVLPIRLTPFTAYYWTVAVRGDAGDEAVSGVNRFETGRREVPFAADWITTPWEDRERHPLFAKTFELPEEKIASARIYVTGTDLLELYLNGGRVGNEFFVPGCVDTGLWMQVYTFDVTDRLKAGKNRIGAMMGNGWAKGRFGTFPDLNRPYTDRYGLRMELRIVCADGTVRTVCTDDTFECADSPILFDNIYNGEHYDANRERSGWTDPDGCGEGWEKAVLWKPEDFGKPEDRLSLPVVIKETRKPQAILHTPAGETVLDMGQNMTGWVRVHVKESAGTRIRLAYGEILQEGNFYQDNLRSAKAEYICICDGKERDVQPHFTYFGFRYVKLEGFSKEPDLNDFTGCSVYSDLEDTGSIVTSDERVNRLFTNTKWSQKDNFLDVPTDCPQRDERMGWTGDAQVFCRTASYHMDTYAFYTKYLHDLAKETLAQQGMVPNVVPGFFPVRTSEPGFEYGGSSVWGDAATIIPWTMYLHYGDAEILKRQYPGMQAWVEWNIREDGKAGGSHLRTTGVHFGDWLALDGPVEGGVYGGTENAYIATVYYCNSVRILAKTAGVLEKQKDEARYSALAEAIKEAFVKEYFSPNGRCVLHTQTAYLLALHFDMVPETMRSRIAKDLAARIREGHIQLKTGFVGTPFLCPVLTDAGEGRLAYDLFFRDEYPGWLYEVKMGATTVWERWNSVLPDGKISGTGMNSLNHYSYGAIAEWMYTRMAGIRSLDDAPGFTRFEFGPSPDSRLQFTRASYNSAMGMIGSGWERESGGTMKVTVKVPFGAIADVVLPDAQAGQVKTNCNGKAFAAEGVQAGDRTRFAGLAAGEYSFTYMPEPDENPESV